MPTKSITLDFQPRLLKRAQAAQYCGLTPEGFDGWRKRGLVPGPIPGTRRWDRHEIDRALDKINGPSNGTVNFSSPAGNSNAYDAWKESRGW